jgi:MFS family permease
MGEPDDYETLFSLLYSVYSFPNIFLPFFGGYLVDRFKARNCQVLFSLLALVGNIVFAVGITTKLWSVMYVGRIIHGCGGISICISALALLAEWFTGKELALAFGCELSVCRLSGVMSNLVNPRVAEARDVESAIWLGVLLCAASFLSALAVHPMDLFVEGKLHAPAGPSDANDVADEGATPVANPMRSYNGVGKLADDSHISIAEREFKHVVTCTDVAGSSRRPSSAGTPDKWTVSYQLGIVKTFSPLFWLLCLSCVCVYGCVFPFNNIASTLLLERNYFKAQPNSECALHDSSPGACQNSTNVPNEYCNNGQWFQPPVAEGAEVNCDNNPPCYTIYCSGQENAEIEAASIMSIPYIITACLCPFFGSLVDTYGQRATVLLLAPAMLCMVHILIGFSDVNMVILLVGQGLSYCSFAAVMWPSVSLVLNPDNYGLGE